MHEAFLQRTLKLKESDQPWISYEIKKAVKQRKKIYKKEEKRSPKWKIAKNQTDELIKSSKKQYYDNCKKLALEKRNTKLYYKAISNLKDGEKRKNLILEPCFPAAMTLKSAITLPNFLIK